MAIKKSCWRRLASTTCGYGLLLGLALAATAEKPSAVVSQEAEVAAAAIRLPAGYEASAVASEPNFENPVAFCFDAVGRVYVAETHRIHRGVEDNRNHMDWLDDDLAAHSVEDRGAYTKRRMGERIGEFTARSELVRLLEDRDADGQYEHSQVFSTGYHAIEDGAAAGVLAVGDRVLFTCIPALWELRDADGDGRAEQKRPLATGFGVRNAFFGHDLHGLCLGPDGRVYFSIGDRGLQVESGGKTLSNPDSGAVLRCQPDGSELEIVATGLRNPQELAFNEFGDLFTVDNNSDSGDRARLVHIVLGMDAGWRMWFQYLPDRGPFGREKIWHTRNAEQPASILPPLAHIADGPSGLVAYPGTGMLPECDGSFFLCDFRGTVGISGVSQFWVEPDGASYRLAKSAPFAEGVLATDCEFGPDGALYVSDWINGWEGMGQGRLHRIACSDAAATAARQETHEALAAVGSATDDELVTMLGHADSRVRFAAQRRLAAAGLESLQLLERAAGDSDASQLARIHAIWALGQILQSEPVVVGRIVPLLADGDPEIRTQAARVLGERKLEQRALSAVGEMLVALLTDPSPRVQAAAALSLARLQYAPSLDAVLRLVRNNNDEDLTIRHAAVMALARGQTAETLAGRAAGGTQAERLAIVLALGRLKSPLVATLLGDESAAVRLEAARLIWDTPIEASFDALAAALDGAPSDAEPLVRRAMAANWALGTPEHLCRVIRLALRDDLPEAMRTHAWELVRGWASPAPRDPVLGCWRPHEPRPAAETAGEALAAIPQMIAAKRGGVRGLVVAAELGVAEAFEPLLAVLGDADLPPEVQASAMAALAAAEQSLLERALEAALRSDSPAVRIAARGVLASRFPDRALASIRTALERGTLREQQSAICQLSQLQAANAKLLLAEWLSRVEEDACPSALVLDVLDAAASCGDAALVERRNKYVEQLNGAAPPGPYAMCLEGGDAAAGRAVFESNTALSCQRCHTTGEGRSPVGPSLADVGARLKPREILESILTPNAKITEGFKTTSLLLNTGQVVSGIVRAEDAERIVMVDANGKDMGVAIADVEDRFEGVSAMPEGLAKLATPRELRDLIAYLRQQRSAPARAEGQ